MARGTPTKTRPRAKRRQPEPEPQSFTMPLLGALYASTVVVVVIFILNTGIGRALEKDLDAPARTLIAAPVVILATVVFTACMIALLAPDYRRQSMRTAEIAGWLIPAWLIMAGTTLGAIAYALHRIQ
jgi:hypothetical protein